MGSTFKNERIFPDATRDYEVQIHTVPSVTRAKNDKIRVESDCNSNSLKQEAGEPAGTWAWARGRWNQLELVPAAGTGIHRAVRVNSKSKIAKKGTAILFQDSRSVNSNSTFTADGKIVPLKSVK